MDWWKDLFSKNRSICDNIGSNIVDSPSISKSSFMEDHDQYHSSSDSNCSMSQSDSDTSPAMMIDYDSTPVLQEQQLVFSNAPVFSSSVPVAVNNKTDISSAEDQSLMHAPVLTDSSSESFNVQESYPLSNLKNTSQCLQNLQTCTKTKSGVKIVLPKTASTPTTTTATVTEKMSVIVDEKMESSTKTSGRKKRKRNKTLSRTKPIKVPTKKTLVSVKNAYQNYLERTSKTEKPSLPLPTSTTPVVSYRPSEKFLKYLGRSPWPQPPLQPTQHLNNLESQQQLPLSPSPPAEQHLNHVMLKKDGSRCIFPKCSPGWQITCRICFRLYFKRDFQALHKNGSYTELGRQLLVILDKINMFNDSETAACCTECALKIQSCFLQFIEIKTCDSILTQIECNPLTENKIVDIDTYIFECGECSEEIQGVTHFIQHSKTHILTCNIYETTFDENATGLDIDSDSDSDPTIYSDKNFIDDCSSRERTIILNDFQDRSCRNEDSDSDNDIFDIVTAELNCRDDTDDEDMFQQIDIKLDSDGCFVCHLCQQVFPYKFELKCHLYNHESPWTEAEYFGKRTPAVQRSANNFSKKNTKNPICNLCFEIFSYEELADHSKLCKEMYKTMDVLCQYCGVMVTPDIATKHWKFHSHHRWRAKVESKTYTCEKCSKTFSYDAYKCHKPCVGKICPVCGLRATKLETHMKTHERILKCPLCNERFRNDAQVNAHLLTHNDEIEFEKECKKCEIMFKSLKEYQDHLTEVHNIEKLLSKRRCSVCQQTFTCFRDLDAHLLMEHNVIVNTKVSCETCGELVMKRSLKGHQRRKHLEGHKISCEICGSLMKLSYYRYHKMYMHRNNKGEKQCPICRQIFPSIKAIDNHLVTHGKYSHAFNRNCSQCSETFTSLIEFQFHVREHWRVDGNVDDGEVEVSSEKEKNVLDVDGNQYEPQAKKKKTINKSSIKKSNLLHDQTKSISVDQIQNNLVDEIQSENNLVDQIQSKNILVDQIQCENNLVDQIQSENNLVDQIQSENNLVDQIQSKNNLVDQVEIISEDPIKNSLVIVNEAKKTLFKTAFFCQTCRGCFSTHEQLIQHNNDCHLQSVHYKCCVCKVLLGNVSQLFLHMKKEHSCMRLLVS